MAQNSIERGTVLKVDGDFAQVAFERTARCDKCRACKVDRDGRRVVARVKNTLGAGVGDVVDVNMRRMPQTLSCLIYLLPVILVAIGIGVGYDRSPAAMAILSAAGLILGLAVALPIDLAVLRKKLRPVMTGFVPARRDDQDEVAK